MKKRALRKDFMREIRKNSGRFISIFFIIALGSAFFAGVRSAKYDMKKSADTYYDDVTLMDLRVLSTLGLTDQDLELMRQIEDVESVTGGHTADVLCKTGDTEMVLHLIALTDGVNEPTVTEGRLPEKKDECFADTAFLEKSGYRVGDQVVCEADTGESLRDTLNRTTFTIVGAGKRPEYMDISRGTSSVGDGKVDAFLLLLPQVFESEIYTEAYIQAEGTKELFCYDDSYKDLVQAVEERLENIEDEACQRRYDEVYSEAKEKLEDAKQEVADGEQELQDAKEELEDGKKKLADGEQTLAEKEQEFADGKKEITDGEKQIKDGQAELADAEKKLADAQAQIDEKSAELASGKKKLAKSQEEYDAGFKEYQNQAGTLENLKTQITQGKEQILQLEEQEKLLNSGIAQAQSQLEELETGMKALEGQIQILREQKQAMEELFAQSGEDGSDNQQYQELCAQLAAMEEQYAGLREQQSSGRQQLEELKEQAAQLTAGKEQLAQLMALEPQLPEMEKQLAAGKAELDAAKKQLDAGWTEMSQGEKEIADAKAQIQKQRKTLASAKSELEEKKAELEEGKAELLDGEKALEDARTELEEKKQELADAQTTYDEESADAQKKIDDAKEEIAKHEEDLADLEVPEWYILNRDKISSYVSFDMDSDRMGSIGEVFPVIFFLVAALVSLTAMTRMIEEQRTAIGTLKALGYSDGIIAMKYFTYAMLATIGGSILGVAVGSVSLPWVIISAYGMLYTGLPVYLTPLNWDQAFFAVLASVASTGIATLAASYRELRAKPAQLMRPEAPKSGRRVLLERVTFIWKRLNFTEKSTIRNLLRYKKRFLMTVIGIGGCMALMLVGFGLQDSITVVAKNQYTEIFVYDASVNIDTKAEEQEKESLINVCDSYAGMDSFLEVYGKTVTLKHEDNEQEATVEVPKETDHISDYVVLRKRDRGIAYEFPTDGVALTEKTAKMLGAKVGDKITIEADKEKTVEAEVSVITENYVLHYLYMAPGLYEKLYQKSPEYNQLWLNYDLNEKEQQELGKMLINEKACTGVTFTDEKVDDIAYMLRTLNEVMYVLIISAGLLAFVVLYNLNSINITERKRELATLKVLGFYDVEVGAYVYRENVILTLIGITAGIFMGIVLHQFVIQTVEVDAMMFGRLIRPFSFVVSGVLSLIFSLFVNVMMYWRLKKIDMIESLKSVE